MSIRRLPEGLLLLVLAVAWPLVAAAPASDAAQRERIARDRAVIEREAQTAQQLCAQQFAVTDCVDRVKAERRQRLRPLDREVAALDDALRKRRASERMARIQQRQASQAESGPAVSVRSRKPATSGPAGTADPGAVPAEPELRSAGRAATSQGDADAGRRAAASAKRVEQAKAHRLAIERRNAERAKQGGPAPSLPLPPAEAASR